ncbi:MAG TPA: ABC transporter ATP-binding protein [Acidiphilium sp.]|nr:MAG: ABC transporter permease [Acidiphilium sp. 21-60-14]OYV89780.1 MAG: ABC transporter permease [Acidiphilium sp. 37-60-79]OZB39792.1 MAG: ABC transporter permease [Acidiphilium sp. 34-60-192]HQT89503.1 ABC transporter ATP-binding protein [Acidiphilium sp.]HQU24813.1 ABC transporter ATP-binding protein [Acidiphilium sp.]
MIAASGAEKHWLRGYLLAEWRTLCAGSAIMAARAGVLLALPWPLKFIIDNVIYQRPLTPTLLNILPDPLTHRLALLDLLGLAMLGLGAFDALLVFIGNRLFLDVGQRVVFKVRSDLFAHVQRLSLDFHRRQRGGELMARLSGDVRQLQDFIAAIGIDLLPHALTILGMATVMLLIDWRYALIALSVAPVLFLMARFYANRLRKTLRLVRRQESTLSGLTQEILGGVQVVQAFARETHEDARFGKQASHSLAASLQANTVQAQFGPMMNFIIAAATGAIAWYGAASVIRGSLTPGELLVFLAYLRGIATPARQFAKTGRIFGRASVALERIGAYRAEQPSITEPPGAIAPTTCIGRVELSHVQFGYTPGQTILDDISFTLEPGRTVALVGATGSGKSTIASLIPRFYDVVAGRILLDDRPITQLPIHWLRRQIGLVLQEPLLFQASIWENIAYGLEGAGRSEAIAAARAVGVDDIIERLPGGFDAQVNERGLNLSGGQRQCVAIARAMLCRAPIVILDEPSSSLDAATEQRLMAALDRLAAQRSALVIAHRLATVMNADLILVLDQGRIVERGTHMDLLSANGHYATLWQASHDRDETPKLRLVSR